MITTVLTMVRRKGSPFDRTLTFEKAQAFHARRERMGDADKWEFLAVPSCHCCGDPGWDNGLCSKHQGRSPCVIEGCRRTRKGEGTPHLCGEHWKLYCPPGSPTRRAINRLFRLAKKLGYSRQARWPDQLEARYWRLWTGIVRRAKRYSTEGHIDQREIERMFGWGGDAAG